MIPRKQFYIKLFLFNTVILALWKCTSRRKQRSAGGRSSLEDALAGYLEEVTDLRQTLDRRYDDLECGRVQPVDGEAFFETLRQREEELLKRRRAE